MSTVSCAVLFIGLGTVQGATKFWTGYDGSDYWNWNNNWWTTGAPAEGDILLFGDNNRTSPNNSSYTWMTEIWFKKGNSGTTSPSFTLLGNAIAVNKIEVNDNPSAQAVNINITARSEASALELNPVTGDLTMGAIVDNNYKDVIVYSGNQGAGLGKTLNFSSELKGTGKLIVRQDAKVRIAGASTYTGNTEIERGDLEIAQGGAVGGGTIYVGVNSVADTSLARLWIADGDGGTIVNEPIQVNDSASYSYRVLGGSNTSGENEFSGSVTLNGSVTVYVPSAGTILYSGIITGSKNIYVTGTGTVKMTGANSYSGQTIIKAGGLVATTLANAGANSSLGAASGANSIIKIGAAAGGLGQLVYTSTSDNSTDRQIQVGDGSAAGDSGTSYVQSTAAGASTFSASTFNAADAAATATRTLTLSGASTANNTVSGVIQDNNTGNGGIVSLRKEGGGKWILGKAGSTFTGQAIIFRGTLMLNKLANAGANSSLGTGSGISIIRFGGDNRTGILEYNGTGDSTSRQIQIGDGSAGTATGGATINNSGSGALTFSASAFNSADSAATVARTLTLGGANTSANTISGVIANNGASAAIAVTKADAGTWILAGASTYSGATTVNAGKLGGAGCSSSATTVKSGATIAPGTSIGTFNTGSASFETGSAVDWEYDDSTADLVAAGALTLATGTDEVTIKVKKTGSLVNCERTLFTFTGTAPSLTGLKFDLTDAPGVTSATPYIGTDNVSVKVLLLPEPGACMLAGLLLIGARAGAKCKA